MGKMNAMALDNQSIIENEWYEEQYALLRSQGYEHDEVEEIIEEVIKNKIQPFLTICISSLQKRAKMYSLFLLPRCK